MYISEQAENLPKQQQKHRHQFSANIKYSHIGTLYSLHTSLHTTNVLN